VLPKRNAKHKCWGDWICGDRSLICDKIVRFVVICREKEQQEEMKWERMVAHQVIT
jgi:hypothetical protein